MCIRDRESGFGRYDVCMMPEASGDDAYVFEFKIFNQRKEQTLEETAAAAVRQIVEKDYDAMLISNGIDRSRIRHYGFAFRGKEVLIVGE